MDRANILTLAINLHHLLHFVLGTPALAQCLQKLRQLARVEMIGISERTIIRFVTKVFGRMAATGDFGLNRKLFSIGCALFWREQ